MFTFVQGQSEYVFDKLTNEEKEKPILRTSSALPDLIFGYNAIDVKNITSSTTSVNIKIQIKNSESAGEEHAGAVRLDVYYSADATLDGSDELRSVSFPNVGDTSNLVVTFPFNPIPEGENHIICVLDTMLEIEEESDGNNSIVLGYYVTENPFQSEFEIIDPSYEVESAFDPSEKVAKSAVNLGDVDVDGKEDLGILFGDSFILFTEDLQKSTQYTFESGDYINTEYFGSSYINDDDIPDIYAAYELREGIFSGIKLAMFFGKEDLSNNILKPDTIINLVEGLNDLFPGTETLFNLNIQNVGDLDGNGFSDLAFSTTGSPTINIWYGGSKNIGENSDIIELPNSPTFTPRLFRLGDVNGDSKNDLAVSDVVGNLVYIYFGGKSNFTDPDVTIDFFDLVSNGDDYPSNPIFGLNLVAGKFDDDTINDIIIMPFDFRSRGTFTAELLGLDGMFLFKGGSEVAFDRSIRIPSVPFDLRDRFFIHRSTGDLFNVGDLNENGFDEIVLTSFPGSGGIQRNAIVIDTKEFNENALPQVIFQTADTASLGFDQNDVNGQNSNAIGDFDRDGSIEILLPKSEENTLYAFEYGMENEPPSITLNQLFEVPEGSPIGFQIGFVQANDNEDTNLLFEIMKGNDAGLLELVENTGEIKVMDSENLNLQSVSSIDLTIKVSDSKGGFDIGLVKVNLVEKTLSVIEGRKVVLFPNPSSDVITISLEGGHIGLPLLISDITGSLIYKGIFKEKSTTLNVSGFEPGVYVIQVGDFSQKFFKE